ncbi:NmrA family transcriptional regulator [Streptomyces sp. CB02488]|uniref:SDR family oxidoreductase n=1 Tax=Streptomyces sp. CB02488 TaxID=1703920 RepID=UPI0009398811|nr:NAD(P)H-binding protein [Streptomyces sp. CB02488]OKK15409.1 NmrA family transcriptional regulator [Streptomyces sp. CB02488]
MLTLVTGSRGRVGSTLAALLHDRGHPVRAASRNPAELAPPAGVPAVACDLGDPGTFPAALDGVDSVFLYAQPSHIDDFLAAARAAGVGHIVLLSSSSVLAPDPAANPVAASHHAVEEALTASPLRSTLLRPGDFASNAYQWAGAFRSGRPVDLPYPLSQTSPIDETSLAEAALAVLTDTRLQGASYHLTGPESLTATEQVELLAAASGSATTVNAVSREAWKESVAPFLPAKLAEGLLSHWAATDGSPAEVTRDTERLIGRPARTFASWAAEHAAAFRP